MKNIALIQIDGIIPNLALMKISAWHKRLGDRVFLIKTNKISKGLIYYDKVYISCVFSENKNTAIELSKQFPESEVFIGGVGINNIKLSDEIEHIMPDYDLYQCKYSMGFTTRGCIRKCPFCVVPNNEGMIKENSDIYEFWDKRHKEIILMDNNILALPEHFKKIITQIKENKLIVDFNQGLDHRLLTPELCSLIVSMRYKPKYFRMSFDDIRYKESVIKALNMLREAGMKNWSSRWYIYVGKNDDFWSVYERILIIREYKQFVFIMRDKSVYKVKEFITLCSWTNYVGLFKKSKFIDCFSKSSRLQKYKKYIVKYFPEMENKETTKQTSLLF